ncbi:MAG: DUF3168 domain-containing protein [Gemmatimonadaceae bacterium]|nr:DUF3168 domain-containing protein [Gemmatimonadaceae bacterium]
MATSMNPVQAGIFSKLAGASGLTGLLAAGTAGVFFNVAPENQNPPYVVFNEQSPSVPIYTMGGVKFENAIYQVKAVTQSNSALSAGTIADQIDAALQDTTLTVTGYTHHFLRRTQNVDYTELGPAGTKFQHRGALYRVIVA